MEVINTLGSLIVILFLISMPVYWVWAGYHSIRCQKKSNCTNRKCTYWGMCEHNALEKQREQLLWRMEMAEAYSGEDLSELKEIFNKQD
ncbi:hypothetical protein [Roseburia sp. 831b]|uniref:hypothetical protein n=1 Tax=Roseburia sp. 831b TaxID=1261635 RepID=UPI0009526F8D|nr:hypothetical protein [Roseburia sp. 831b]MDY4840551.1 hypothetical protein [Lachnospiraceae bacterium]WVK74164.1 hypothetical protein BIV16_06495 [Roseburia sp. 831b]